MRDEGGLFDLLKRAFVPAACLVLIGYFLSFAIGGPTGMLAWRGFDMEKKALQTELAAKVQEKQALQKQVELLDPKGVDPDLADELVRKNLNMVKPDEVIITLPEINAETAAQ